MIPKTNSTNQTGSTYRIRKAQGRKKNNNNNNNNNNNENNNNNNNNNNK